MAMPVCPVTARRERLRRLAMEITAGDMNELHRNSGYVNPRGSHSRGTNPRFVSSPFECKACSTLHSNEGSYLAHTYGRRHQLNLQRRQAFEAAAPAEGGKVKKRPRDQKGQAPKKGVTHPTPAKRQCTS